MAVNSNLVALVEELELDEKAPADDIAEKLEEAIGEILQGKMEEQDYPDPREIVTVHDLAEGVKEAGFLNDSSLERIFEDFNLVDTDDLSQFVKDDELEDALKTLGYVRIEPRHGFGGFFRRLKWLLTGR